MRRPLLLIAVAMAVVAIGCSSAPAPSVTAVPSASPSASPVTGSPSPSASPLPVPATPSPAPTATPTGVPRKTPAPSFTAAEQTLLEALRVDSKIDCAPRRADLPPGAVAGVECHIGTALVDRVGVYGFDGSTSSTARAAYLARLESAGVTPATGDCKAGTPGDAAWPTYLPDEGDDGGLSATRAGCYLDANGIANIRLTCYAEIYMGVLGANGDIAALNAWTWKLAKGESIHRDPPGLCAARD
jgi:hypothetical protein